MKKLLLVLAIGSFVACNNETATDAANKVDSAATTTTNEAAKVVDSAAKVVDSAATKIVDTLKK